MNAADMLALNKHYQTLAAAPVGDVVVYPFELRPAVHLPMTDAASLCVVIEVAVDTDYIQIHVHRATGTESWIRIPERRSMVRRLATAQSLRDAAAVYSLEPFLAFITDCGFARQ